MRQKRTSLYLFATILFVLWSFPFLSAADEVLLPEPTPVAKTPQKGLITLPWADFQEILKRYYTPKAPHPTPTPTPEPPPVDFLMPSARYEITVLKNRTTVEATFQVDVLKREGFVAVPLLSQAMALREIRVDGSTAPIWVSNGTYQVIFQKPGKRTVRATYTVADSLESGTNRFILPVVETPVSTLQLTVPLPKTDVIINPSRGMDLRRTPTATIVEASIPPTQQISIEWVNPLPEITEKKPAAREARGKLYAEVATLISAADSYLRFDTVITYSIVNGESDYFELTAPKGLQILEVNGEGIRDWEVTEMGQGKEVQRLHVHLNYPVRHTYEVHLLGEQAIQGNPSVTAVPEIRPLEVERDTGFLGIETIANVEILPKAGENLNRVDLAEIPTKLAFKASRPILFAYKFLRRPFDLQLEVKRNKDVPVQVATVDQLDVLSIVLEDGLLVQSLSFNIRNTAKQSLQMRLPKDARILSVFVGNKPARASLDKEGHVLVPLEKSAISGLELQSVPVEVIYQVKQHPLRKIFGYRSLDSASYDIATSRINYRLYLPQDYQFHLWGNLESKIPTGLKAYLSKDLGGRIHAKKSAVMAPQLNEDKRSVESAAQIMAEEEAYVGKEMDRIRGRLDQAASTPPSAPPPPGEAFAAGVLSGPKPTLPAQGTLYTYYKTLAKRDWQPRIHLFYSGEGITYLLTLLALSLTILGGRMLRHPWPKWVAPVIAAIVLQGISGFPFRFLVLFFLLSVFWPQLRDFFKDPQTLWRSLKARDRQGRILMILAALAGISLFGFLLVGLRLGALMKFAAVIAPAVLIVLLGGFLIGKLKPRETSTALLVILGVIGVCGLSFVPFPVSAQEKGSAGKVEILWEEFEPIIKSLLVSPTPTPSPTPAEMPPPVDYVLSKAFYKGVMGRESTEMVALFQIQVLAKKWLKVPVLPRDTAVRMATIDERSAPLSLEGDHYVLLVQGPITVDLKVDFTLPAGMEKGTNRLTLNYLPTPANGLELTLPIVKTEITLTPSHGYEMTVQGNHTLLRALLPYQGPVQIEWKRGRVTERAVKKTPKIYAEIGTLVNVREGSLDLTTLIDYNIIQGEVDHFYLLLPKDVAVKSVSGEGKREWDVVEKEGQNVLRVFLNLSAKGFYRLTVQTEKVLHASSAVTNLPEIRTLETERDQGEIGIITESIVEVTPTTTENVLPADIRSFTEKMGGITNRPILFAYRFLKERFHIELTIVRNEDIAVQTAAIDSVHGKSLFVEDGQILHWVTYTVRNTQKQYLKLKIPQGAEILGAFLDHEAVSLSENIDEILQIPLLQSVGTNTSLKPFRVELYYLTQSKPFHSLLGRSVDFLPAADVPSSKINWTLYLPEENRYPMFLGNLKQLAADFPEEEEPPVAEPYSGARSESGDYQVKQQTMNRYNWFSKVGKGGSTLQHGGIPVKIQFPLTGLSFHFEKLMAQESWEPQIKIYYVGDWLVPSAFVLSLIIAGWASFLFHRVATKRMMGPNRMALLLGLTGLTMILNVVAKKWLFSFLVLGLGPALLGAKRLSRNWHWQTLQEKWTPQKLRLFGGILCVPIILIAFIYAGWVTIFFWFLGLVLGLGVTIALYAPALRGVLRTRKEKPPPPGLRVRDPEIP